MVALHHHVADVRRLLDVLGQVGLGLSEVLAGDVDDACLRSQGRRRYAGLHRGRQRDRSSASTNDFAVAQERDGTTTLTALVQDQANFTGCWPASGTSASPSSACRWSVPSHPATRGTKSRGPGRDLRDVAICGSHQFGVAPPVSVRPPTVPSVVRYPLGRPPACTRSHGTWGVSGQGPATVRRGSHLSVDVRPVPLRGKGAGLTSPTPAALAWPGARSAVDLLPRGQVVTGHPRSWAAPGHLPFPHGPAPTGPGGHERHLPQASERPVPHFKARAVKPLDRQQPSESRVSKGC